MSAIGKAWRGGGSVGSSAGRLRARLLRPFALPAEGDWWRRQWAREADVRSSFHLLPLGLMLGILLVHEAGWRPPIALVFPLALLALGGASALAVPIARWVLLVAGCLCLGMASATYEIVRTETVIISGEATTRLEGRVLWRDKDDRGRWRYLVAVTQTSRPVLSRPPTRAEILVSRRHDPLAVGATYRGLVRLRPPSGPVLPGGYDFAEGAFFEGLGAQGFGLGPPEADSADRDPALTIGERLTALRLTISDRIRDTVGGAEGAVASAIITGERSGIPRDVDHWLRATGLSHVLSISGLHMALVAGFMMLLVRSGLAAIPILALNLPGKKVAAGAALSGSTFYWALSGMDVATTRSFVMIAIMLLAVICDRAALTLRNVSLAAVLILLTTPHALLTASFQMSFAATAAIIAAYGIHARRAKDSDDHRRPSFLKTAVLSLMGIAATSLVAGLATGPYSAFHFQRIAPFGLIANMATLPLFSFWIMPLALLAMIAMPFGLDRLLLVLLGKGLGLVFAIAHFLADQLPDDPVGLLTRPGLALLTIALLSACFLASALRWIALPIALVGLAIVPDRAQPPDLLLFENGRELALIDEAGRLRPLNARPNAFVFEQWRRAYPQPAEADGKLVSAFTCETIPLAHTPGSSPPAKAKGRPMRYCSARSRQGLRIIWTDDSRRLGRACDEGDIAIVARAIRLEACRSGARLFTLRTLRRSGSIAVSADPHGSISRIDAAMPASVEEWNRHRLAPWPERWVRPADDSTATNRAPEP